MSYILDALKKAEAERHGGQRAAGPIPPSFHVHAQRPPAWRRPWAWSVLSAAAVVAGGLIWMGRESGTQPSEPQPPAQVAQQAQPAAPAAAPSIPPVAQAPAAPAAPAVQPPSTPAAIPMPPATQPPAKAPEQPAEKPKAAERKPAERKAPETANANKKPQQEEAKAAAAPSSAPADKPKPAPEPQVGTLRDLPVQLQREVPQYTVGGYIYSGNKADRSVVINKRLLREGDEIAPGLTLERMTPTGMVLNYKGYRYRASY